MAGKNSGRSGTVECRASQRLPGGIVAEGAKSGAIQKGGGGTKNEDEKSSRAQPDQSLPAGWQSGGQGSYPHGPLTTRDYAGVRAQPNQHLPQGHYADGMSEGKAKGATRGADAYQGPRGGEDH